MSIKNSVTKKAVVVGAGFVGATAAYAMMISGLFSEMVLVDVNRDKLKGEVLDLQHGASFVKPVRIDAGDYADAAGADVVIITAGANQKEGETRLDLVKRNVKIFKEIIPQICKACPDAIILVVSNPVDILTYATLKISGFPPNRVIGSGTMLDSSRFRRILGDFFGIAAVNIHAYIIGEHGDSEVPVWSLANVAGVPLAEYCRSVHKACPPLNKEDIFQKVKNSAYEVISGKGATYYAIGLAVRRIMEAVIRDEKSILTVSSLVDDLYGISGVCLSLPSITDATGVNRVLELPLNSEEAQGLSKSAALLKSIIKDSGF